MNVTHNFAVASKAADASTWIFRTMTVISGAVLLFPTPTVDSFGTPLLVVGSAASVACSFIVNIYQTCGNRLLRRSQLADAFSSSVTEPIRSDYYNSPLNVPIPRLASTTLENSLFSLTVIAEMLKKERRAVFLYAAILGFLLALRSTPLNWVALAASAVFSGDVLLSWMRMERFRLRVDQVHEQLKQVFLQGNLRKANSTAIILSAYTDYECAKDEAALPLDSAIFDRINGPTSARWEQVKLELGITDSKP